MTVLAAVLAVGIFDQTTKAYVPPYDATKASWREDAAFFSMLEDRLPPGAMVVQLPYEPFPEPGPRPIGLYEPAKAYLHSEDLRWSWGAMRGRPDDWAATIAQRPAAEVVDAAREEGFAGIVLDRVALAADAAAAEADLRGILGGASVESAGRRYVFLEL